MSESIYAQFIQLAERLERRACVALVEPPGSSARRTREALADVAAEIRATVAASRAA